MLFRCCWLKEKPLLLENKQHPEKPCIRDQVYICGGERTCVCVCEYVYVCVYVCACACLIVPSSHHMAHSSVHTASRSPNET